MASGLEVLSQGFGYGIVVGIGGFFALFMLALTYFQNRYTAFSTRNAEEFNTASRSVKPGLIATGIVSSWTWSATLLTSSTFAYSYGISGGMWYAANGTLQILLFGLIAIKIKAHAPGAHTFPEIVLSRHGRFAHLSYWFFGMATNMLVGSCLVLGGSQVVAALSGVNVYAACWLIPFVVAAYVVSGGLRSTFIADYTHTVILYIAILVFGFTVYEPSGPLGGLDGFYDLLVEASEKMPVERNHNGSYLTFHSVDGLIFAWNLLIAGFANVWLDQAYWQRAIASQPHTSVKAYIAGGIAWYGIPFGFATAMGLGCVALTANPSFPTYPEPLTAAQNGAGLSAPATAIAILGKGGAGLMLLLLFMAVTSATSAELIAASSLLTFDIYKTYIRPRASSTELVNISHGGILLYASLLAGFCCILNAVSIDLTWILTVLGVIVGGGVFPVALVLLWPRMSWVATCASPWAGLASGLTAWFVVTKRRNGTINVHTSGEPLNALAGNVTSVMTGLLLAIVLSFVFPAKYSSSDPEAVARDAKIKGIRVSEGKNADASGSKAQPDMLTEKPVASTSNRPGTGNIESLDIGQVESQTTPQTGTAMDEELSDQSGSPFIEPMDHKEIKKATRLAIVANAIFILVAVLLVPYTLFGSSWTFSRAGFKGWCVMSFIWVWVGMFICVFWPPFESRSSIARIFKGIFSDMGKDK
ncbi:Sodium:solute symporter family-domain-containing protein [Dactylonectria macrodidyma]|uniref:Sodium:solute symporter family-domain-containing protein n=1 Tax=Dactylonectria macrodidyma TaxID=307937 RepID=A0A9P9EA82_9HYPO|nr:Sodium:solute symporter family-domain-containing protein [Dactylonectria macrodidyma]